MAWRPLPRSWGGSRRSQSHGHGRGALERRLRLFSHLLHPSGFGECNGAQGGGGGTWNRVLNDVFYLLFDSRSIVQRPLPCAGSTGFSPSDSVGNSVRSVVCQRANLWGVTRHDFNSRWFHPGFATVHSAETDVGPAPAKEVDCGESAEGKVCGDGEGERVRNSPNGAKSSEVSNSQQLPSNKALKVRSKGSRDTFSSETISSNQGVAVKRVSEEAKTRRSKKIVAKKKTATGARAPPSPERNSETQVASLESSAKEELRSRLHSRQSKILNDSHVNPTSPDDTVVENSELEKNQRNAKALTDAIMAGYFSNGFGGRRNDEDWMDEPQPFVPIEKQKSLKIAIIGAPNAGKSVLTNRLVGSKITAVSRKTNTTQSEILGICTMGDTQLLIYDTPGLLHPLPYNALSSDGKKSTSTVYSTLESVELLVILIDAERQLRMPDPRVKRMVIKLGSERIVGKKKIAVLNKVDIVKHKEQLLPMAKELSEMHAIDDVFMISGQTGSGVKELISCFKDSAVLRPWDEDPDSTTNQTMQDLAMEIIHEHLLDRLHQNLPYIIDKRLTSWKYLSDGSIRIEVLILVESESQKAIVVGKSGQAIRQIGMASRVEIDKVLGIKSHVILNVKIKPK